jgi:hypothetical protein
MPSALLVSGFWIPQFLPSFGNVWTLLAEFVFEFFVSWWEEIMLALASPVLVRFKKLLLQFRSCTLPQMMIRKQSYHNSITWFTLAHKLQIQFTCSAEEAESKVCSLIQLRRTVTKSDFRSNLATPPPYKRDG